MEGVVLVVSVGGVVLSVPRGRAEGIENRGGPCATEETTEQ